MKEEVKEGLRWVLGNRYLRWIAASTATFNLFASIIFSIFLVFAVRELDLVPGTIGLIFAVANVGYLVGALVANKLGRRFGVGPTIIMGALARSHCSCWQWRRSRTRFRSSSLPRRSRAWASRSTTSRRSASGRRSRRSGCRAG